MKLQVFKQHPNAIIPTVSEGNACFDLHAHLDPLDQVTIHPGQRHMVPTGLTMRIPNGYEVQVRPRSGLAAKSGITVLNTPGTIDSSYRGPVNVILINLSSAPYVVRSGDRIAQAKLSRVETFEIEGFEEMPEGFSSETSRGAGGFGSSGR